MPTADHSAFSLTVTPAKIAMPSTAVAHIGVFDSGKIPVHITMRAVPIVRVDGRCNLVGKTPAWVRLSPQAFTLSAGHHKTVRLSTLAHTGHPHGLQSLSVQAVTVIGHRGSVQVSGAVATQTLMQFPGQTHGKPCVSVAAPERSSSPVPMVVGAVAAILVIVALCLAWRRYRGKSGGGAHRAV